MKLPSPKLTPPPTHPHIVTVWFTECRAKSAKHLSDFLEQELSPERLLLDIHYSPTDRGGTLQFFFACTKPAVEGERVVGWDITKGEQLP